MHKLIVRQIVFGTAHLTDMTQLQVYHESLYFIVNIKLYKLIILDNKPEYGANSVESPGKARLNSCNNCDFFSKGLIFVCIAVEAGASES